MAVHAQYLAHAFPHDLRSLSEAFLDGDVGSRKRARPMDGGGGMGGLPFVCGDGGEDRVVDSGGASTSDHGLLSHLHHQNVEIDALIRFQSERLRAGLEEARRRHVVAVVTAVERAASAQLQQLEAELAVARGRGAELEGALRRMRLEAKIWQGLAQQEEERAAGLRAAADKLLQDAAAAAGGEAGEGTGAEDAQSAAASDGGARGRRACWACGEAEACVLLLPCRHLCLCRECDAAADACPACAAVKNASLHVLLP